PMVVLDVDRGEKPQGYFLPLDDTSPLYGKTWREIGLDAFANHRSQGIAVFLGSAFLRRPIALKREDGQPLNPAMLAEPLGPLDEDYEKVENALVLVAGLRLEAVADRSEIVPGETFTVRVESRHREGVSGDFKKPALRLPPEWSVAKEEQESPNVIRFTVQPNSRQPHVNEGPAVALLPEPPPLLTASEEVVMDGYAFTVLSPVTSVRSTSTRVDRISPVVVPPYTLAVEPKQDLQNLSKPRKPFDVLLRVHSYATEPGQTRVGVVVPKGWKASAPVALKFNGTGDRYARVVVAPPQNLAAGRYKITAYVERAADRSRNLRAERFS